MSSLDENIRFFESFKENLDPFYDVALEDLSESESMPIYSRLKNLKDFYTIEELIGEGGMKRVYRVHDKRSNRPVAFARLKEEAPRELYEAFLREGQLTANLEHPNIISVHEMGVTDKGVPFFTMELKVGHNLQQILTGLKEKDPECVGVYGLEGLLEIFLKICDAVAYAHSRRILHLDLKPENIQIGRFGEVIVCDWGLGKYVDAKEGEDLDDLLLNPDLLNHLTMHGECKGTPGYIPPEHLKEGGRRSFQSDIYALGAILYGLLTLEKPMEGTLVEVLKKTLAGEMIWPRDRSPERSIPIGLDAVVRKAMAPLPQQRYGSVELLRQEVRKYISGHATQAEKAGLYQEVKLFYRRNRSSCWWGVGMMILLLGGGLIFFYFLDESRREALRARDEASEAREVAEKNLALYQQAELEKTEMHGQFFQEQRERGNEFLTAWNYFGNPTGAVRRAIECFDLILEKNPEHILARKNKGLALFFSQRFDQAAMEPGMRNAMAAHDLSLKYAPKTPPIGDCLAPEDFLSLMDDLAGFSDHQATDYIERSVGWAMAHKKMKPAAPEVVKRLLQCWNLEWSSDQGFDYDPVTKSLHLSGKGLTTLRGTGTLTSELCFLRYLPLKSLDLRGSDVDSFWELKGLSLTTLDVRRTRITEFPKLKLLSPTLMELTVAPGQFSEKVLKRETSPSLKVRVLEDSKE